MKPVASTLGAMKVLVVVASPAALRLERRFIYHLLIPSPTPSCVRLHFWHRVVAGIVCVEHLAAEAADGASDHAIGVHGLFSIFHSHGDDVHVGQLSDLERGDYPQHHGLLQRRGDTAREAFGPGDGVLDGGGGGECLCVVPGRRPPNLSRRRQSNPAAGVGFVDGKVVCKVLENGVEALLCKRRFGFRVHVIAGLVQCVGAA